MTRKEAAEELKRDIELDNDFTEDYINAVNMAIEALEQEPCEDAISRQSLLKLMSEEPFNWTDSDEELQAVEDYRNFRNMVEQLPSVNQQKPKKSYISIDDVMSVFDDFMCGEVDEEGTETFLEMLKDKAESEDK